MPRNFGNDALSNRIMGTRFDVEVSRHFYPELYDPAWLAEGKELTRVLMLDGAGALEKIVEFVERRGPAGEERAFVAELSAQLRATERVVRERCKALARELMARIGRGRPLTELGGDVATPLQTQRGVGTSVVLAH